MINILNQHSYSLRVVKDVTELSVELLDIASKYELFTLFPQLADFSSSAKSGILIYQVIQKPFKVIQYGQELFTKPPSLILVAGNIAHCVKDIFKLIGAAQGLGILPPNIYVLAGLGPLVPHICMIATVCSIVNSTVKAMKTWHSANPLVKQNLDFFQVLLNSTPKQVEESSRKEFDEISGQVTASYSATMEHNPNQVASWHAWKTCKKNLSTPPSITNMTKVNDTIAHAEFWLSNFGELASEDPILALEKESLEFGLVCFYTQLEEETTVQADKEQCARRIKELIKGKENRIYRSRYCSLKQGVDLFAGAVAIALMLQADQSYKVFKWYTLLKKTGTVSGYVLKWSTPTFNAGSRR